MKQKSILCAFPLKKMLSVILTVVMVLSVLPMAAFAEEWKNIANQTAQDSAQEPAAESVDDEIEYTGDLLSVEVTVGNKRSVYAADEDGRVQLVSEETVSTGGPLRAPQQPAEDQGFDIENVDPQAAYVAAKWAMEHPFFEATTLLDRNGVATVIYGIGGTDQYLIDENHDLICDVCGYCADGCTDGKTAYYTQNDIAGEAVNGEYFNTNGELVGRDAVGVYTYEMTDENDNPILDDDGNPVTTSEEYEFIQFESYIADRDGYCDVCGKPVCKYDEDGITGGHDYSNGICDGCGACLGAHVDGGTMNVGDEICDDCGLSVWHILADHDGDGFCDDCGVPSEHEHVDLLGGSVSNDGICDACGWCIAACDDADADGVCDICGKTMLAYCEHSDLIGSTILQYWVPHAACGVCGLEACHRSTKDMLMLQGQMGLLAAILAKGDEDGKASYHNWLTNTLTPALTAKTKENDASEDSFASLVAMRQEFRNALDEKAKVRALFEKLIVLTADDLTPYSLAGEVRGDTVLDDGCVYSKANRAHNDYLAAIENAVFEDTPAYYAYETSVVNDFIQLFNHLDDMAGAFFDAQLEVFYGSSNPTWFEIDENNYATVRKKLYNFDEALLYRLYGTTYKEDAYKTRAKSTWDSKTALGATSDRERRAIGFAMLDCVRARINEIRETVFSKYKQTTYDDENGVYVTRPAFERDILRDASDPDDTYQVTDETINAMIRRIDGFAASPEAMALLQKLLPGTFEMDVKDANGDNDITIYDFLMSFLTQKLLTNDLINELFSVFYPLITDLGDIVENLLKGNPVKQFLDYEGDHTYGFDLLDLMLDNDLGEGLYEIAVSANATVCINGGKAPTFKKMFRDNGYAFWPSDIATLLGQVNGTGKYTDIIEVLNGCSDDWEALMTNGKLNFDWGMENLDDFKNILFVLLGSVAPLTEMLFAKELRVNKNLALNKIVYLSLYIHLLLIELPAKGSASLKMKAAPMHLYDDVLVPIFEALGVNSFTPSSGTAPIYNCTAIFFDSTKTATQNARTVVDAILDPITVFVQQLVSHPVEKLLSILPNLSLMMENGKLFELFDFDYSLNLELRTDFKISTYYFDDIWDIVEDNIMKHWYDWLKPWKYAQLINTVAFYWAVNLAFDDILDYNWVDKLGDFGIDGALNGLLPSFKGLPLLPNILNSLASLLGGHLGPDGGGYTVSNSVKLQIKLGDIISNKKLNLYDILEGTYLDAGAVRNIGFDLNQLSSVVTWFFRHLRDADGNNIRLFDPAYLDLAELGTLGELQKKSGSVRSANYAKRWNTLNEGQYYHVNGDTADVFYYFVRLLCEGVLQDDAALDTVLGMLGLNKEKLGDLLSNLADKGADVIGVTLSELVTNACDESGKLSIDRLLSNLTTDNLLLVLCELLEPSDSYELESITYPETPAETKSEIDDNDGVIPYLEYDNFWTKNKAEFVANDIDDVVDTLLKEIPIDLDPDKEGIETIRAFAKPFILGLLNQPDYLTTIVELLTCFYSDGLALPADLINDATGVDISAWYNDFGYLFDAEIPAPTEKVFPDLTGSTGTDGKIIWRYNGNPVETYSDIFAAFGYVLSPADPILNMVLCGEDFNVMTYTKGGQPTGSLLTIKGNDGYNFTLIPLLEAMGISDVMTSDEFRAMGTAQGLLFCVDQIVNHLFEIFDSETILADLLEMLAQLGYAIGENGLGVILKNSLHPLFVLIDTLRPVLDIDINALLNTLLCRFTYKIGGFEDANEMMSVLRDERHAEIRLNSLNVDELLDLVGVVLSSKDLNGERKYLDLKTAFHEGMRDLAYLRDTYTSKAYALDENGNRIPREGYYLNLDGPDALTSLVSMVLEMLMTENNADALDALIGNFLRKDGSKYHHGIVKTALELLNGIPAAYTSDYDWAYILGDDATADEKAALIETIKQNGSVAADDYRTAQSAEDFNKYLAAYELTPTDERSAAYLAAKLDAMIESALNIETDGSTLGVMLLGRLGVETDKQTLTVGEFVSALLNGLLNDAALDSIMGTIGKLINGLTDDLAKELAALLNKDDPASSEQMINELGDLINQYKEAIFKAARYLDLDIEKYNIDSSKTVYADGMVTYYDFSGAPTGLTRHALAQDLANFGEVASELLMPIMPILSFLLLGRNLALFNTDGVPASRERRDDLINVTGIESYRYVLLPLLDALGCKNLKPADQYDKDDYNDVAALVRDMFGSLANRINELAAGGVDGKVIDGVLALLPELLYFFNSNAAGISMANFAAPIDAILGYFNTYSGRTGDDAITVSGIIRNITGKTLDVYHLSLIEMLCLALPLSTTPTENALCLNEFLVRLLENFTIGKIYYKADSPCDFDMFGMTYRDDTDKAKMITILISLVLDALEDPNNEAFLDKTLGKPIAGTLRNIFRLEDFEFDYQDPTWLFTEYADTDHLVSALTLSKLFNLDPYAGKLWTREMAAELADNLDQFVEDMLYLLGLEINGLHIKNLRELMHALIGGSLFTDDVLNALASLLGQIKPLLDKYDPNGAIAGFIKELIDVDLHAWDDYAKGGKYENGRDWGFAKASSEAAVDANGAVFEAGLVELLSPAAPVLAWLLADSDFTLFAEGDGLGENAEPIQLTFPGAEGYKYALVPLFEALNIDGSPKNLVQNLRDGDICDPAVYTANVKEDVSFAVTGVVHPLVAFIQKLMDSTATQLLELLPSLVYFINSNGIDTVVKNLIHAVMIIGNAAEPLKEQISALVYDDQGLDLYRTLNLEKIVKENLYGAIGVKESDVKAIYEQCGGTWKTVDGVEDVDFRLLFSVGLAAVNNLLAKAGVPLKFTSIAALAVNELTHGFVRSYDSWTGKTAYTMVLDKEIDRYCYGDLLSVLMRIILKFLAVDDNVDALVALIKTKANIGGVGEAAICAFLHLLAGYMGSLGSFEVAMLSIYYTVYGASRTSGSGVEAYDHVNDKLGQVVDHLKGLDNDIARAVLKVLIAEGDEQIGDIVGSQGVAGNGLIRFFKQIADWFMRIINFFKELFRR